MAPRRPTDRAMPCERPATRPASPQDIDQPEIVGYEAHDPEHTGWEEKEHGSGAGPAHIPRGHRGGRDAADAGNRAEQAGPHRPVDREDRTSGPGRHPNGAGSRT